MRRRVLLAAGALGVLPAAGAQPARAGGPGTAAGPGTTGGPGGSGGSGDAGPPGDPAQALARLRTGNERWVRGQARHPDASSARRHDLAGGQAPFAVVFTCVDSRVPPELVFDQGLGDLLVVRTAAHTLDTLVAGSLEYGPVELATPLLLVLGHQHCGAVTAAVRALREGTPLPGHLAEVAQALRAPCQAVAAADGAPVAEGEVVEAVVREQIRQTVARLRADELLAPAVAAGRLAVRGGYYALDSGVVDLDPDLAPDLGG
ncbi:carbonic anhydrase [Kitasatospora sp. NBC_01287]|uniref:carbonic anhydrase n=1 Tax=Kitasatospora sp. NBC_01287 TaxID=2903573 RepID=UPI00224D4C6F|nr:carbonic anhydrase [Kitasatospora sp. NBC_01287]MCX4749813.1 carbonic anhydrase [Kitasatospora sp. NBC_01287]